MPHLFQRKIYTNHYSIHSRTCFLNLFQNQLILKQNLEYDLQLLQKKYIKCSHDQQNYEFIRHVIIYTLLCVLYMKYCKQLNVTININYEYLYVIFSYTYLYECVTRDTLAFNTPFYNIILMAQFSFRLRYYKISYESPSHSWNLIVPICVSAVKSGKILPNKIIVSVII